jgi:hypothetical protein
MADIVYLFFYDGTPISFTHDDEELMFETFEGLIPSMMRKEKSEIKVLNIMLNNLKILANKLYNVSEDGDVNLKNMKKAWGKDWMLRQLEWCMFVHCISKMSPAHVNNEFGMVKVTNAKKAFGKDYKEYDMSECASCSIMDVKQKKCGRCEAVHYCSPECQKAHWKTHKLTCVPLTK